MKLDFFFRLKRVIGYFLQRKARKPVIGLFARDEERDRSAREYELHYWGAMPGLWY
ncbi:hypothetical protein RJJ37_20320 [Rhizobium redzepovicii]|uniref:Uncharacterized protein n=1 Tax=Rhizobium redzepovicii TaxID=2867518 RepID=A0AAW8P4Q2_9HYPH|nr:MULTISPECIES: hypothetical protein [Rhizobium]MBB3525474.1 hypothetical protein [Rhizobium sp. BK456]MBY4590952.1 hypothetical protein [Rhizobium redzepovicii]MBY4615157.1 hypothetical protein [Rhizobium redzepovicii]MDF0661878.1 hypothetical protein [Rhizobium sp. BC49]MDR9761951.1 hypothetical protein [Rhizobium redzepovicii]